MWHYYSIVIQGWIMNILQISTIGISFLRIKRKIVISLKHKEDSNSINIMLLKYEPWRKCKVLVNHWNSSISILPKTQKFSSNLVTQDSEETNCKTLYNNFKFTIKCNNKVLRPDEAIFLKARKFKIIH